MSTDPSETSRRIRFPPPDWIVTESAVISDRKRSPLSIATRRVSSPVPEGTVITISCIEPGPFPEPSAEFPSPALFRLSADAPALPEPWLCGAPLSPGSSSPMTTAEPPLFPEPASLFFFPLTTRISSCTEKTGASSHPSGSHILNSSPVRIVINPLTELTAILSK